MAHLDAGDRPDETAPPRVGLTLFEQADGWRYEAVATYITSGALAFLEARHHAHARLEDKIRHAKDSGLGRSPWEFTINKAWTVLTAIAADLVACLRLLALARAITDAFAQMTAIPMLT